MKTVSAFEGKGLLAKRLVMRAVAPFDGDNAPVHAIDLG